MWRQYRWQLMAFAGAILLLMVAVGLRTANSPTPPLPTPIENPLVSTIAATPVETVPTAAFTAAPALASAVQPLAPLPLNTFREGLVGSVQRLNPLYTDLNTVDRDITALIFEGLVVINEYGEPVPQLALNWVISADGLEYVVTLRQDILWQDGVAFDVDDVLYTFGILQDPAFDGLADLHQFWKTIELERLSDYSLRFRLTQPLSSFLTALTTGILPEHALSGTTASDLAAHPFNLTPIGTGAYQLQTLATSDGNRVSRVVLRRAASFVQRPEAQGRYAIDTLRFDLFTTTEDATSALANGTIDAYAIRNRTERAALLNIPNVNLYSAFASSVGVLIYNWNEGDTIRFFRELRTRVALQRALNIQAPVEAHLTNQALVANSPLLPNSWAYANALTTTPADTTEALQLLLNANIITPNLPAEATAEPDTITEVYRFTILVPNDPALIALAQEFATQWSQLRLAVSVESVSAEEFQQRLDDGTFTTAIVELPLGADPDQFAYWHIGQAPDGRNYGSLADDRISELLERARRDPFGVNRIQLYRQFQEQFIERAVALPIYYPLYTYAINTRVMGVQLGIISSPTDRFRTLGDWQLAAP